MALPWLEMLPREVLELLPLAAIEMLIQAVMWKTPQELHYLTLTMTGGMVVGTTIGTDGSKYGTADTAAVADMGDQATTFCSSSTESLGTSK